LPRSDGVAQVNYWESCGYDDRQRCAADAGPWLHASTSQLQWIVDAYNLVFAALVPAAGSVSDRAGRATGCRRTGGPPGLGADRGGWVPDTALSKAPVSGLATTGSDEDHLSVRIHIYELWSYGNSNPRPLACHAHPARRSTSGTIECGASCLQEQSG